MSSLLATVWSGSFEEVLALYAEAPANRRDPSELLLEAFSSGHPETALRLAHFMLDEGADPATTNRSGYNALQLLFAGSAGRSRSWSAKDGEEAARLVQRLLAGGADVNCHAPGLGVPLRCLYEDSLIPEAVLTPVYDVLFAQPGIEFGFRRREDGPTLGETIANTANPARAELGRRVRAYLEHPPTAPLDPPPAVPDRVYATAHVLDRAARVRWLRRQTPVQPDDTGWRVMSGIDTADYTSNPENWRTVALDDLWPIEPALVAVWDRELAADGLLTVEDTPAGVRITEAPSDEFVSPLPQPPSSIDWRILPGRAGRGREKAGNATRWLIVALASKPSGDADAEWQRIIALVERLDALAPAITLGWRIARDRRRLRSGVARPPKANPKLLLLTSPHTGSDSERAATLEFESGESRRRLELDIEAPSELLPALFTAIIESWPTDVATANTEESLRLHRLARSRAGDWPLTGSATWLRGADSALLEGAAIRTAVPLASGVFLRAADDGPEAAVGLHQQLVARGVVGPVGG